MKPLPKNVIISVIVFLALLAIFSTYSLQNNEPKDVSFAAVVEQIQSQSVSSITVEGNKVSVTLQDGTTEVTQKESDASLTELLTQYGISTGELKTANITVKEQGGGAYLLSILLPSLIPILLLVVIFWFMIRQMQGANNRALSFGQSGAREMKDQKQKVTFADVAGAREAKEELLEVVEFLKNPKKFVDMGAKLPKGVLLMGRPGTGKTLMARAIAGEADVPFLHISGSEFVEMFVGVGASRVRDLFQRAKKSAPCIIFVDEIDAVGRQRGTGL